MYAAKIAFGWVNQWFEGETPTEIIKAMEKYQDFGCLIRMGRENEDEAGQKELDKLEAFLKKYHDNELTMDDIKALNIHLSISDIVCHEITEK